jgi:hypothetical protein
MVLRFGIAVAGGPREHRRPDLEFEQVLLLTRRWQGRVGTFGGELLSSWSRPERHLHL